MQRITINITGNIYTREKHSAACLRSGIIDVVSVTTKGKLRKSRKGSYFISGDNFWKTDEHIRRKPSLHFLYFDLHFTPVSVSEITRQQKSTLSLHLSEMLSTHRPDQPVVYTIHVGLYEEPRGPNIQGGRSEYEYEYQISPQ